ncbi:MAG: 50S ribosomal protein L21 [Candidatus Zhuqueibacterota bacterium]
MYAIVEISGIQFKVSKNDVILAPNMEGEVGKTIELDHVLFAALDNEVKIGDPVVPGAQVKATILNFEKGKKVIVFKKKRKKEYQRLRGDRAHLTRIKIDDIIVN